MTFDARSTSHSLQVLNQLTKPVLVAVLQDRGLPADMSEMKNELAVRLHKDNVNRFPVLSINQIESIQISESSKSMSTVESRHRHKENESLHSTQMRILRRLPMSHVIEELNSRNAIIEGLDEQEILDTLLDLNIQNVQAQRDDELRAVYIAEYQSTSREPSSDSEQPNILLVDDQQPSTSHVQSVSTAYNDATTLLLQSMNALIQMQLNQQKRPIQIINSVTPELFKSVAMFGGGPADNANQFIRDIEYIAKVSHIQLNNAIPAISNRLTDKAYAWQKTVGRNLLDYAEWKSEFIRRFKTTFNATIWFELLATMKRESGQSVYNYLLKRKQIIDRNPDLTEQAKLQYLTGGLHDKYIASLLDDYICDNSDATFIRVLEKAERYDNNDDTLRSKEISHICEKLIYKHVQNKFDYTSEKKIAQLPDKSFNHRSEQSKNNHSSRKPPAFNPNFTHRFKTALPGQKWPLLHSEYSSDHQCRWCKKPDHKVYECKSLKTLCLPPPMTEPIKQSYHTQSDITPEVNQNEELSVGSLQAINHITYATINHMAKLPVILNDRYTTNAIDDSGSSVTCISQRFVDLPHATPVNKLLKVMQNSVSVKFVLPKIKVTLGPTSTFIYDVHVIDDNNFDLLLGQDWRRTCGLRIIQDGHEHQYIDKSTNTLVYRYIESTMENQPIFSGYCSFISPDRNEEWNTALNNDIKTMLPLSDSVDHASRLIARSAFTFESATILEQTLNAQPNLADEIKMFIRKNRDAFLQPGERLGRLQTEHRIVLKDPPPRPSKRFCRPFNNDLVEPIPAEEPSERAAPVIIDEQPHHKTHSPQIDLTKIPPFKTNDFSQICSAIKPPNETRFERPPQVIQAKVKPISSSPSSTWTTLTTVPHTSKEINNHQIEDRHHEAASRSPTSLTPIYQYHRYKTRNRYRRSTRNSSF